MPSEARYLKLGREALRIMVISEVVVVGTWSFPGDIGPTRLIGQLLQGPAVAVRVAEGGVQDSTEILHLADLDPALV